MCQILIQPHKQKVWVALVTKLILIIGYCKINMMCSGTTRLFSNFKQTARVSYRLKLNPTNFLTCVRWRLSSTSPCSHFLSTVRRSSLMFLFLILIILLSRLCARAGSCCGEYSSVQALLCLWRWGWGGCHPRAFKALQVGGLPGDSEFEPIRWLLLLPPPHCARAAAGNLNILSPARVNKK